MSPVRLRSTRLPDVRIVEGPRHEDDRGTFQEVWNARAFSEAGIRQRWVQLNEARSRSVGTLRGIHYQLPPTPQAKLVRVVRGAVFDVAVDLRSGSPTFGGSTAVELREGDGRALLIPRGFGHGYLTLEPDTVVQYLVDGLYAPAHERGIRWDDPTLGIRWPIPPAGVICSERDRALPTLAEQPDVFPPRVPA